MKSPAPHRWIWLAALPLLLAPWLAAQTSRAVGLRIKDSTVWRGKAWPAGKPRKPGAIDRVVIRSTSAHLRWPTVPATPRKHWFTKRHVFTNWRECRKHPHYYIDRAGAVYRIVAESRGLWQGGDFSPRAIIVALAGLDDKQWQGESEAGRAKPEDRLYTDAQYHVLGRLLDAIARRRPGLKAILSRDLWEPRGVLRGKRGTRVKLYRAPRVLEGPHPRVAAGEWVWLRKWSRGFIFVEPARRPVSAHGGFPPGGWTRPSSLANIQGAPVRFDPGQAFDVAKVCTKVPFVTDHEPERRRGLVN